LLESNAESRMVCPAKTQFQSRLTPVGRLKRSSSAAAVRLNSARDFGQPPTRSIYHDPNPPQCRTLLASAASVVLLALAPAAHADTLQDISKQIKQGQHAQALEQIDKYLAGKPKDAQGRFLKGIVLTEMNKPNEAIAVFSKLTEDYPGTARALQQPGGDLRPAEAVRQGQAGAGNGHPHPSVLRHRPRKPRRHLRPPRQPGLRQGTADRLVELPRAERSWR
jgi:predicted Zn-dependent protease